MARPRKLETDDRYNEESLNLQQETKSFSYDLDADDTLPELGATDHRGRFASLNDRDLFDDNRS